MTENSTVLIARHQRVRRGDVEDQNKIRQQIIEAASEIYHRDGLEALTMRAVAAAVGMSAMGIYRYFNDKSSLIMALWDDILHDARLHVKKALAAEAPARVRLRRSIDAYLEYWENNVDHFRLVYMTDQTLGTSRDAPITMGPDYQQAILLSLPLLEELTKEIGGNPENVLLARDLRLTLMVGYLHSRLVNFRYPWTNLDDLRQCIIDSTSEAVEHCLIHGPARRFEY
jgi:AcrR family transcriptional regulator